MLLAAQRTIAAAIDAGHAITPAAEWLIDNYHLVERRFARSNWICHLATTGSFRSWPIAPLVGYPRVFGVAWAFVAHTDSHFNSHHAVPLHGCLPGGAAADDRRTLRAIAITLARIVLVENLRRIAAQIVDSSAARREADGLADRLLGLGGNAAEPVAVVFADRERMPLPGALAVQLVQRLHDQDPRIIPALTWLDERLAVQGTTTDVVVHGEHQRQGAATVTVHNIITSMRLISDVDWTELFERISPVDKVLAAGSGFSEMDFPTRNLYRDAIEELARGSNRTELDIAHNAVLAAKCTKSAVVGAENDRLGDPGYHLLAGGRRAFEAVVGFRPPLHTWLGRLNRTLGIGGYVSAIAAVAAVLLGLPLCVLAALGLGGAWLGVFGTLGAVPAIDAAVALVNSGVTRGFGATLLPGLELRNGVPSNLRTLVAVPVLLTSREEIQDQIEQLEIHHLASLEGDLHFALLSDWRDAATEHVDGDGDLFAAAVKGIAQLNHRHGPAPGGERFMLLHRRRVWTESEGQWIGWERKRGKLHELNRLLRGASDTTFMQSNGQPPTVPTGVRYVVTLDADTKLPRDTVRRLIGKMAHPLNRPRFDTVTDSVVEGYAVLQPRVTPLLPVGHDGSLFQRAFSSKGGIDPYAGAVSDVYQDLFGEGSYIGKGIYDIDAFEVRSQWPGTGFDASQPRSIRRCLRPRRSRLRCRGRRGVSRPL